MQSYQKQTVGSVYHKIDVPMGRKILGFISRNYSDTQMQQILTCLYDLTEVCYEFHKAGKLSSGSSSCFIADGSPKG